MAVFFILSPSSTLCVFVLISSNNYPIMIFTGENIIMQKTIDESLLLSLSVGIQRLIYFD